MNHQQYKKSICMQGNYWENELQALTKMIVTYRQKKKTYRLQICTIVFAGIGELIIG